MNGWLPTMWMASLRKKGEFTKVKLSKKWLEGCLIYGALTQGLFGNLTYVVMMMPALILYVKRKERFEQLIAKRNLLYEFVDFLDFFNVSVMAGYSMENSIITYVQKQSVLSDEGTLGAFIEVLSKASKRLQLGGNLRALWQEIEREVAVNEIQLFCKCLTTSISTGGNWRDMIYETSRQIKHKIVMEQEIEALVAEKRLEVALMGFMPYGVLFMMKYTMADLIVPIFTSTIGVLGLFVLFLIFEGARVFGDRIVDIKV